MLLRQAKLQSHPATRLPEHFGARGELMQSPSVHTCMTHSHTAGCVHGDNDRKTQGMKSSRLISAALSQHAGGVLACWASLNSTRPRGLRLIGSFEIAAELENCEKIETWRYALQISGNCVHPCTSTLRLHGTR